MKQQTERLAFEHPMFRTPKAPISDGARDWLDGGMDRLIRLFGKDRLKRVPAVLATREFFPAQWEIPEAGVEELLQRVCTLMGIPRERIQLVLEYEDQGPKASIGIPVQFSSYAGLYQQDIETGRERVTVKLSNSSDPVSIVSIIAHELCHVHLLGDGVISREEPDGELLTDLLTVFLGFGVITANAVFRMAHYSTAHGHGYSMRRQGYLSEAELGYALALWTMQRGEHRPKWAHQLNRNARAYFDQSIRYLQWRAKQAPSK